MFPFRISTSIKLYISSNGVSLAFKSWWSNLVFDFAVFEILGIFNVGGTTVFKN